jgi:signal transduction histidine kinase
LHRKSATSSDAPLRSATAIAYARHAVAKAGISTSIVTSRARTLAPSALIGEDVAAPALDPPNDARIPLWRRAFAGVTPSAIGIIVALVFIRIVSATADLLVDVRTPQAFAAYLLDQFAGLKSVFAMVLTMIAVIVLTGNLGPQRGVARAIALILAAVVGSALGVFVRLLVGGWFGDPHPDHIREFVVYVWPRYFVIGGLLTIVFEFARRARESTALARKAELDEVALGGELAAAQLQVLQAQIEPHFLFNTLANVRRLYDEDPAAGRKMLEMLMRYIEIALPEMRRRPTLAREAELIEAYLHIQKVRMGPRLAFAIDIPRALGGLVIPPMMLLTLVENAIKHGLTPSPEGGRLRVSANVQEESVVLTVADTGLGFGSGSGTGIGLANVSARLASQFGDRARLVLENNEFGGATASITLPLQSVASA